MKLATEPYLEQAKHWPPQGRHVLAQFDDDSVIVYQAYSPSIGRAAVEQGRFGGGEFSFNRMSWIKPNFLWMMYRSGWGTMEGQEITLAVRLRRESFDEILNQAVHSTYLDEVYFTPENWKTRLAESSVRLQWDPDHDPRGGKQQRRAIQLGLAGAVLGQYADRWIVSIEDISDFVAEQRAHLKTGALQSLITPLEEVYPITNQDIAKRVGIETVEQKE